MTRWPLLAALLSAVLFGAATPASKPLLDVLAPLQLAGLLYLGAALGVLPMAARRGLKAPWALVGASRPRLFGAILLGGVVGPVALLFGLRLASAASVSLWLNLELVATALLGHLLYRDHLGRRATLALGGVVASAVVLSVGEGVAGLWAALLVALACLCWGFDNHLTALVDEITPAETTLWKGLVAGAVNLGLGLVVAPWGAGSSSIAWALLIGALAYGVSIMLYIGAAQGLGATRAQMIFASAPFFGLALAATALGEGLTVAQGGAALLLVASLAALFREQHDHEHAHEPLEHTHSHRHDDGHHDHSHEGLPAGHRHTHAHAHRALSHSHAHWPDLHHRHAHAARPDAASE